MRGRLVCVGWALRSAGILAALLGQPAARAQSTADVVKHCVDAHGSAQEHWTADDLLKARQDLQTCARAACPSLVQAECTRWLAEVVEEIPSVVLEARVDDDNVFDVSVSFDGSRMATRLDGKPIEVNPGLHTFVFERPGVAPIEKKVIVAAHRRSQLVSGAWKSPAPAASATTAPATPLAAEVLSAKARPLPVSFYMLGGVAVAAFATFAILGISGDSTQHDLEMSCSPHCSDGAVESLRTRFIAANVFGGVGTLAAAGALGVLLLHPRDARSPGTAVAVGPTTGGIAAEWKVRF